MADTLVSEVISDETPYQYDAALSFLQPDPFDPRHPVRISLFLPDVPLAIDLLGMEAWPHYAEAAPYIAFGRWAELQVEIATKRRIFSRYSCTYLPIYQGEPCDASSLKERMREILGFYLP